MSINSGSHFSMLLKKWPSLAHSLIFPSFSLPSLSAIPLLPHLAFRPKSVRRSQESPPRISPRRRRRRNTERKTNNNVAGMRVGGERERAREATGAGNLPFLSRQSVRRRCGEAMEALFPPALPQD